MWVMRLAGVALKPSIQSILTNENHETILLKRPRFAVVPNHGTEAKIGITSSLLLTPSPASYSDAPPLQDLNNSNPQQQPLLCIEHETCSLQYRTHPVTMRARATKQFRILPDEPP